MSDIKKRAAWLEDESPRQAALNFIRRYWGLEAMQRQRMLVLVPMLPDGEDGYAEDD